MARSVAIKEPFGFGERLMRDSLNQLVARVRDSADLVNSIKTFSFAVQSSRCRRQLEAPEVLHP
jgi:hypothetical protein